MLQSSCWIKVCDNKILPVNAQACPVPVYQQIYVLHGVSVAVADEEFALQGIKQLKGVTFLGPLNHLPKSPPKLTLGKIFNQKLDDFGLPDGLQSFKLEPGHGASLAMFQLDLTRKSRKPVLQ